MSIKICTSVCAMLLAGAYSIAAPAQEGAVDALIDQVGSIVNVLPLVGPPLAGIVDSVDGTLDALLTPLPLVGGLFGDGPEDDQDGNLLTGLGGLTLGGGASGGATAGTDGSSAGAGGGANGGLLGTALGGNLGGNAVLPPL